MQHENPNAGGLPLLSLSRFDNFSTGLDAGAFIIVPLIKTNFVGTN